MVRDSYKWRIELLYLAALCLYLCLLFLNQTEYLVLLTDREQAFVQKLRYLCYLAFLIKILAAPAYSRRYLFAAAIAAVCALCCAVCSDNRQILFAALAVIAAYDCDARRILRCAGAVFALGLALTLLLCASGVLQNAVLDAERGRQNLGFNWVTLSSIYYFFISIAYLNWRGAKTRWTEFLLLTLGAVLLYKATNARFTLLMNLLFLCVCAVELLIEKDRWPILDSLGRWVCLAPIIVCIAVLVVQRMYLPESAFWSRADALFSNRFSLADQALSSMPVKLFGQPIQWIGYSLDAELKHPASAAYNNVDISYLRILLHYGAAGLLLSLFIYMLGLYKSASVRDHVLTWSYLVILVFSVTEQWMIELTFNYLPLVAGAVLTARAAAEPKRIAFRQIPQGEGSR